jgi:hypothetical protein
MTLVQNLNDTVHIIPGPELTINSKMTLVQNIDDKVHTICSPESSISTYQKKYASSHKENLKRKFNNYMI